MQSIDRPVDYLDIRVGLQIHIFTAQKDRFSKGHHVRRCLIFCPKSSEEKKKSSRLQMPNFFAQTANEEQNKIRSLRLQAVV